MRWCLPLLLAVVAFAAAPLPTPSTVRVRLLSTSAPRSVTLESDAPLRLLAGSERLDADARRIEITARSGRVRVSGADRTLSVDQVHVGADAPLRLRAGRTDRTYSGSMRVRVVDGRLQVVNEVPLVDYVASVVASEYPFSEIEGIKAQAVLARTYVVRRLNPSAAYDIDDHVGAQVYKGAEAVTDRSWSAASETRGETLTYGGELAEAVYSSSSGGHTADNETIWNGRPVPYLRGVPDPYDADSPDHTWTTTASAREVHRALSRRYRGSVRGVRVADVSREGRVRRIALAGSEEISGSDFRAVVNQALGYRTIRSTRFELAQRGGDYVFTGRGFGHGVGMSQYGARAQAREGRSYRDILAYYFKGTEVTSDPGAAPVASSSRWPTRRSDARGGQAAADSTIAPPVRRTRPTPRREARTRRGW